jgi:hypothetical protein
VLTFPGGNVNSSQIIAKNCISRAKEIVIYDQVLAEGEGDSIQCENT